MDIRLLAHYQSDKTIYAIVLDGDVMEWMQTRNAGERKIREKYRWWRKMGFRPSIVLVHQHILQFCQELEA